MTYRMTARTTGGLRRLVIVGIAMGSAGVALGPAAARPAEAQEVGPEWAIAVHGGAGTARRESMTPEVESRYTAALTAALEAGREILASGGSSLDAVEAALRLLEDSPLFNAGKGAVFTHDGRNELDASIMDGASLAAGAVAGLSSRSLAHRSVQRSFDVQDCRSLVTDSWSQKSVRCSACRPEVSARPHGLASRDKTAPARTSKDRISATCSPGR